MGAAVKRILIPVFLMIVSVGSVWGSGYDRYFVSVDWLKKHLGTGLVILDAREGLGYRFGHIPGALPVTWKQLSDLSPEFGSPVWGTATDMEILSDVISNLGITKASEIVIYADTHKGWGEDGRIFWTLRIAGLSKLKMLDGGIREWRKQNGPISLKRTTPVKSDFRVSLPDFRRFIDTRQLKSDYAAYTLVDTRAEDEYNGAVKFGEKRGGHLPGAMLLPYTDFLVDGLLKPVDELNRMLTQTGLGREDRVVLYCTAGIRSAYVQVIMEMLGYDRVKNYDESFYIWASDPDTTVGRVIDRTTYLFISAAGLHRKIKNSESVIILDIRPETESKAHPIKGAISTGAYPVQTDFQKARLGRYLPRLESSDPKIVVVSSRGDISARRTVDYFKKAGISPSRLLILEGGQNSRTH